MTTALQTTTAEDLLHMPQDGFRYELVRGEMRKMAPAGHVHGRVAMKLSAALFQHVEAHRLGVVYAAETGFLLSRDPDTVLAPDVAFVSQARIEEAGDVDGYWPGAPDLAVEVVSPSDRYRDVEQKALDWLDAGAAMVLLIDPRRHVVSAYRSRSDIVVMTEGDALNGGDVVPGWAIPIEDLFA